MPKPIGEVLHGIELEPLPEGWIPLEIACAIKCVTGDGDINFTNIYSDGWHFIEALGAMRGACVLLERQARDSYRSSEDEDH